MTILSICFLDLLLKSSIPVCITLIVLSIWKNASASQRGLLWTVTFGLIALLPLTRLLTPAMNVALPQQQVDVFTSRESMPGPHSIGPVLTTIQSTSPSPDITTLMVDVWWAGVVLLLFYRLTGSLLLFRYFQTSSPIEDEAITTAAEKVRCELGIHRRIEIRISPFCKIPVTWGTRTPVVMLPVQALDWTLEWLGAVFCHEMGHIKNYDHLKRSLAFLVCAIYWPNPLVWLGASKWQLTQEEASDDLVLQMGCGSASYVDNLVGLIRVAGSAGAFNPAVAMARRSSLEGRLSSILDGTRNRQASGWRLCSVGTGLAILLGIILGAVQMRAEDSPKTEAAIDQAEVGHVKEKLKNIAVSLDFEGVSPAEAFGFLARESTKLDPSHQGVPFVILPNTFEHTQAKSITLNLNRTSLGDALRYVCALAGIKYRIRDQYVLIEPVDQVDPIIKKVVTVPDTFFDQAGQRTSTSHINPIAALIAKGISFPPGASATYDEASHALTITNTSDQIELLMAIINATQLRPK